MGDLPEFVYLVTVDTEWPVNAVADCHPSTAERIAAIVKERGASANVYHPGQVHVWKARLTDMREVGPMYDFFTDFNGHMYEQEAP